MKKTTLITSALVALGIISQASAQTTNVVYITGSTAFRTAAVTAMETSGVLFDAAPTVLGNPTGSQGVLQGTIGGTNYALDPQLDRLGSRRSPALTGSVRCWISARAARITTCPVCPRRS